MVIDGFSMDIMDIMVFDGGSSLIHPLDLSRALSATLWLLCGGSSTTLSSTRFSCVFFAFLLFFFSLFYFILAHCSGSKSTDSL